MDLNFDFDEQLEKLGKVPRLARMGAVVGILLGVVAGYYFLSYEETSARLTQQRGQAQELQRKLTNVRAVANNVPEFKQEVAMLERELKVALKQLPDRKQFEDLLQDITTAGKKVGVTLKSIERSTEIEHDFYAEVPVSLEREGTDHNNAMLFERVAKLPRIVNVGAMTMEVTEQNGSQAILKVEGNATTFRFLSSDSDQA
jgi:type IV pilus assembly protein PilO